MKSQINENHMWLVKHGDELDKYSGRWVAIDQAKLIASADTLQELNKKTKAMAAKHPLFFLVPKPEEEISIL